MIMLTDTQRTDEWYYARLGRITGSVAGDMLATIKKGESASRRNLRTRLVLERLTGVSQESRYVSVDMQYGIDREPAALVDYEARTGYMVRRVGFCAHDELQAGASDRKSTRLNSSHLGISYAVFCLKKKKKALNTNRTY